MSSPMPIDPSMCCICYETVAAGDHWQDETGQKWDVHRGVCAIEAGHVSLKHRRDYDWMIATIKVASGENKQRAIKAFYEWAEQVAADV